MSLGIFRALPRALAVTALAAAGPASASTFARLDLAQLKGAAETVVRARVVGEKSYWNPDRSMIFTDYTLAVSARLSGASDDEVVVRVPGGTVGKQTVEMDGAPRLTPGDEVVVFLGRWRDGRPKIEGYEQGVSRVVAAPEGGSPGEDGSATKAAGDGPALAGGVADGLSLGDLERRLAELP